MQLHLSRALHDFRRCWLQLLITDFLSLAIAVVVATPLVGLLLRLFLLLTEDNVLTDTDIATFFLHPLGLVALLILGTVSLTAYLIQLSLLMVIGFGATEDRRVTYLDALRYVFRRTGHFARLAGRVVGVVLLVCAPFLAAVGGAYLLFLSAYDINYYLANRPTEFWVAVALAGTTLAVLAGLLLRVAASWVLALPVLLFEDTGGPEALRRSKDVTAPDRGRIAAFLAGWVVGSFLVSAAGSFLAGRLGGLLVPDLQGNWILVVCGLAATLAVATLTSMGVQFFTTSLLPLVIVRWYRELAGPGRLSPPIAEPGSLGQGGPGRIPGKAVLGAAAAAVIVVLGAAYASARSIDPEELGEVIAHRGASGGAPENTMAAFELAHTEGADWIEIDVQEDADGTVIVAHDSDFMKQARSSLKVWEARAGDLRDLDIGSWFDPALSDQRVATLREVLEWAKGRIGVVIELKYYGHDETLEARVVEIVESAGMESEVQVMSLKRPGLRKFAELRPDWTRGLLNTASIGNLTRLDVDFLALNSRAATPRLIRNAHERGMKVYVWTINDPVQMSVMLSRGADGIITDEPALAREVLELRENLSPLGGFIVWMAGEIGLLHRAARPSDAADA